MPPSLKGRILLLKSYSQGASKDKDLSIVTSVEYALNNLTQSDAEEQAKQHLKVAEEITSLPEVH